MSMPSSSALVDTTARTVPSPQTALDLAPPLRQVAAAVPADLIAAPRRGRRSPPSGRSSGSPSRGGSGRRRSAAGAASGTRTRRDAPPRGTSGGCRAAGSRPAGSRTGRTSRRAARRSRRPARRAAPTRRSASSRRVRDGGRGTDEHRVAAVVLADAPQPAQHVGEVAAEHAAIRVQLVDDHEPEVLEQLRPARMVRQHARMQHVGVAEHDVRTRADRTARILRRVAVVGEDADLHTGRMVDVLAELVQLGELVLCERLGGEQVQRARGGVLQDRG